MPAGNANPDETFRYDAGLAGYIYNLRTSPLATGTWEMTLAAGLDSTTLQSSVSGEVGMGTAGLRAARCGATSFASGDFATDGGRRGVNPPPPA